MQSEPADDYVRRLAAFIRLNAQSLAQGLPVRRRPTSQPPSTPYNPLSWLGIDSILPSSETKPAALSMDIHHLFYLLMRFEGLGISVGSLDVKVDSPSRPMSYINLFPPTDKAETLSLASLRSSLSVMSTLSLSGGWWRPSEAMHVDSELKFLYSSFTKLPALILQAPGPSVISETVGEPPNENALPLDVFKNLQSLACLDVDPRALSGWDRLAESLRSLKIQRSGMTDVSDIFIRAVLTDEDRRKHFLAHTTHNSHLEHIASPSSSLDESSHDQGRSAQLSSLKWLFLKSLALPENSITSFPVESISHLTSLTHLDLSSNLLVSIPPGLSALHNLISLNLADNMIDSVLGIYLNLGQVLSLNLADNRLESLCGLERLYALERVDLRGNLLEESSEVGRLATLPNIVELYVQGNPFVELEENYRISCFTHFWNEGKAIVLDGSTPTFYEKRNLKGLPVPLNQPHASAASSPPAVAIGTSPAPGTSGSSTIPVTPNHATPSSKAKRKRARRIVNLDDDAVSGSRAVLLDSTAPLFPQDPSWSSSNLPTPQPALLPLAPEEPEMHTNQIARGITRHARHRTDFVRSPPPVEGGNTDEVLISSSQVRKEARTLTSRSTMRRARVSASVYEPSDLHLGTAEAGAYRRRIEALKQDMGDGWLKVFSQSEMKSQ
ncbi:hypothetical protein BDN72DRAFT_810722 [Pluteus cervinus]|uniref:Uncharacterized protein n=1 Tax=Pluteus cervinus TaxID=181527 RepID=A0ACD3BBN4_9AGAR|nr:hypothetical protein BDN72DRAFT_810722 [Pluteus cervinus]